jgi:hypothetical protein
MNTLERLRKSRAIRLDAEEAAALADALQGISGEAWLFGSRIEPQRRGGDIDDLLLTDQPAFETSQTVATRFLHAAKNELT